MAVFSFATSILIAHATIPVYALAVSWLVVVVVVMRRFASKTPHYSPIMAARAGISRQIER